LKQGPSLEDNSHSDTQKIPRLWWNPKVHHRVHKIQSLVPILNQTHPVPIFLSYISKIHFNIIFPSTPTSFECYCYYYCYYYYSFLSHYKAYVSMW